MIALRRTVTGGEPLHRTDFPVQRWTQSGIWGRTPERGFALILDAVDPPSPWEVMRARDPDSQLLASHAGSAANLPQKLERESLDGQLDQISHLRAVGLPHKNPTSPPPGPSPQRPHFSDGLSFAVNEPAP